ncbi:hypothetical protein D3C75_920520 [compost metagenome]
MADTLHNRHIMADENEAQSHLLLQLQQQIDDLHLHRYIQCGNSLIRHDRSGPQRQGPGNAHALALPA